MPYLEANQPEFHDLESGDGPVADRIVPYLRSAIFPALAASRRAARATAPQVTFADTDRIVPYLRSL